jgi:hypothetical protein
MYGGLQSALPQESDKKSRGQRPRQQGKEYYQP